MTKKRILIVSQYLYPHSGGISSHISTLKGELERRGFDVDVLSLSSLGILGTVIIRGPSLVLNKIDNGLGFAYRYPTTIVLLGFTGFLMNLKNKYSLIHSHDVIAYNAARIANMLANLPVVLTIHGYLLNEALSQKETRERYSKIFLFFERLAKGCKRQLAADTRIRDYLVNVIGVDPSNVRAYRNFIDPEVFAPSPVSKESLRIKLRLPAGKVILFCPRRLVVKNGVIFAARAIEHLPDDHILLIAGFGPEEEAIRTLAERIGNGRIILLGKVKNHKIADYYCASDYTIIPSITVENVEEATSISAIESMACGTPVIGSSIGGIKELIKDKENGLLVEQKNPKAIADAVILLEKDKELVEKIIRKAKEKVKNELCAGVFVDSLLENDYKELIKNHENC